METPRQSPGFGGGAGDYCASLIGYGIGKSFRNRCRFKDFVRTESCANRKQHMSDSA
jgi:hypothetical protein